MYDLVAIMSKMNGCSMEKIERATENIGLRYVYLPLYCLSFFYTFETNSFEVVIDCF